MAKKPDMTTKKSERLVQNKRPRINAVLFDLDNTLLDRHAGFTRFCRNLYRVNEAIHRTHLEQEAVDLMTYFATETRGSPPEMFGRIMRQWPGAFANLEQALDLYYTSYPQMLVLDQPTKTLLHDLQRHRIPCAIVTNGPSVLQMNKVQESGLKPIVQAVVISGDLGVEKPDKYIFEQALDQINANPDTTLFVGDDPEADILGSKGLGMLTAWMHWGRQWPYNGQQPDYTLDHVSEVRDIVIA